MTIINNHGYRLRICSSKYIQQMRQADPAICGAITFIAIVSHTSVLRPGRLRWCWAVDTRLK